MNQPQNFNQQARKPVSISELPRYMMFGGQPGAPLQPTTPKLVPSVIGQSKVGFTVFDRSSGTLQVISFSFYIQQLQDTLHELRTDIGKPHTEDYSLTVVASRPAVESKPNRPTDGKLTFCKHKEDGTCTVTLEAGTSARSTFTFAPISGNMILKNGKELKLEPYHACLSWLNGLLKAAESVADLVAFKAAKQIGGDQGV